MIVSPEIVRELLREENSNRHPFPDERERVDMVVPVVVKVPVPRLNNGALYVPDSELSPVICIDVKVSEPLPEMLKREHPVPSLRERVRLKLESVRVPVERVKTSDVLEKVLGTENMTVLPPSAGVTSVVYVVREISVVSLVCVPAVRRM